MRRRFSRHLGLVILATLLGQAGLFLVAIFHDARVAYIIAGALVGLAVGLGRSVGRDESRCGDTAVGSERVDRS